MSAVLLVGTGSVGLRAARQLVDTPGQVHLLVASRDPDRADELATVMGPSAAAVPTPAGEVEIPGGVAAMVVATDAPEAGAWVRAAVTAGVPVATTLDEGLGELEAAALATGATVITGCGLAPGLSDVLARHAADAFQTVHEVHVARVGGSGRACVEALRAARRQVPGEWRAGAWRADRAFGPELVWFPEPIGARECQLVAAGVASTAATVPGARHVTVRFGAPPSTRRITAQLRGDPLDAGWGAARVEVVGVRDHAQESLVYGVVDRVPLLVGVVLAVTALGLAGVGGMGVDSPGGVRALGEVVTPVPFLGELGRRGVKAAVFEGVAPAA